MKATKHTSKEDKIKTLKVYAVKLIKYKFGLKHLKETGCNECSLLEANQTEQFIITPQPICNIYQIQI